MRMMSCVMECGIPFQIAKRYTLSFCNIGNMPFHKIAPHFRIIISKTNSVLTSERNNVRPDIAFVICYFVSYSIKNDRFIFFIKQTVRTSFLNSRSHSHIAHKILPISDDVGVTLNDRTDKLRCVFYGRISDIVPILKVPFGFGKIDQQIIYKLFLIFCSIIISVNSVLITNFNCFTGCNVLCVVSALVFNFLISAFQIAACDNQL